MGCSKGEIELGFSTISQVSKVYYYINWIIQQYSSQNRKKKKKERESILLNLTSHIQACLVQIDIQTALGSLFPEDFYILSQPPIDQNPPSASSSSWIPLSTGSRTPECSSFLFSIPGTSQSYFPETLAVVPTIMQQPLIQGLAHDIPSHFPTPEGEHDAIIRALVDVISPPSSSTSHQHQAHQNLPHTSVTHPEASAFKIYTPDIGPRPNTTPQMGSNSRRQSLMKRSIAFSRSLHLKIMRQRIQASRPTSSQLHHTISERRRREKLNESFQALRALLPPGTKVSNFDILFSYISNTCSFLICCSKSLTKRFALGWYRRTKLRSSRQLRRH